MILCSISISKRIGNTSNRGDIFHLENIARKANRNIISIYALYLSAIRRISVLDRKASGKERGRKQYECPIHGGYYTIYRMSFSASRASIASPVRQRLRSRITFGPMRS